MKRLLSIFVLILMIAVSWQSGLLPLWMTSEEYGHGLMVFLILLLVIYQRHDYYKLDIQPRFISCLIPSLLAAGLISVGLLSGITILAMYGNLVFLAVLIHAYGGMRLLQKCLLPLAILLLLIPLPNPFGPMLTAKLQLISSQLGVFFIRLFGGTVYLEGNVIEMGSTSLMVAEACAGLRYLFPLMSLGAILAFMMTGSRWIKWVLFLLTIPITVVLNSLRIAVTGFLTENYGRQHTEGFLHFFEGWVVFIVATCLLMLCMLALARISSQKQTFSKLLEFVDIDWTSLRGFQLRLLSVTSSLALLTGLSLTLFFSIWLQMREEFIPQRQIFTQFPVDYKQWHGSPLSLSAQTEAVSAATDYLYMDFVTDNFSSDKSVNFYVAYYASQKHGNIPHSPKVCMPGDGWKIVNERVVELNTTSNRWNVNRLVIQKGTNTIISYYWIQQGEHAYTAEFKARLDLIRRAFLKNRTDGALVRIYAIKKPDETEEKVDARIRALAFDMMQPLKQFVPY